MTKHYYGTKQVVAWPEAREGREGYAVRYEDGYTSWSPASAFEAAYKPNGSLDFAGALTALKAGRRIARSGWNGKGMWLDLQTPDAHSKMSLPYIYMRTVTDDLVPWLASQTDMLAEDWAVIGDPIL